MPLIKDIQFFKERDIKESDLNDIVQCLTYEYKNSMQKVFDYGTSLSLIPIGSFGDKFYVILQGEVSVLVPNKRVFANTIELRMEYRKQRKAYMERRTSSSLQQPPEEEKKPSTAGSLHDQNKPFYVTEKTGGGTVSTEATTWRNQERVGSTYIDKQQKEQVLVITEESKEDESQV